KGTFAAGRYVEEFAEAGVADDASVGAVRFERPLKAELHAADGGEFHPIDRLGYGPFDNERGHGRLPAVVADGEPGAAGKAIEKHVSGAARCPAQFGAVAIERYGQFAGC